MLLSVSAIYGLCLLVIGYRSLRVPDNRLQVGSQIKGKVVDVINGNTFVVQRQGRYILVRVSGLREPDGSSPWKVVASWALVAKLQGRSVRVMVETFSLGLLFSQSPAPAFLASRSIINKLKSMGDDVIALP